MITSFRLNIPIGNSALPYKLQIMEATIINRHTKATMNVMFDKFYQISALTDRPEFINPNEELYNMNGHSVQMKHWATFLAIANEEVNFSIAPYEYGDLLRSFLISLEESGEELIQILDAGYVILMERVVTQN